MAHSIDNFQLALPQPYYTGFGVRRSGVPAPDPAFQILLDQESSSQRQLPSLPIQLHNEELFFTGLNDGEEVPETNNTQWARVRRSPSISVQWKASDPPSVSQVWLVIYSILSFHSEPEQVRFQFQGPNSQELQQDLLSVGLAVQHPKREEETHSEILILRSAFWQGAGSPFGPRPIWLADPNILNTTSQPLSNYPPQPVTYTLTNRFPTTPIYARHPIRPKKPTPGSTIYSRYIPHLTEHFSMVALDYKNTEHLQLFHKWQNDPRVAQGWNETGTMEQHKEYLRKLHEDPHVLTVLARFEETFFAYFEIYWAKEDTLGAHYPAHDYDRGRHSLVGDIRFRGPNRVSAWWSSLMHYIFLDEPRTMFVVGEPKATNTRVLAYDLTHGFNVDGWVDFPHKRSAIVRCSRERFFGICPFGWDESVDEGIYAADKFLQLVRGSKL